MGVPYSSSSSVTVGSDQVKIINGRIIIKTEHPQKVLINGHDCLPCSELASLSDKFRDDPELKLVYDKYCDRQIQPTPLVDFKPMSKYVRLEKDSQSSEWVK